LQKLDRKTRKLLTIHGQQQPKADINCSLRSQKTGRKGPDVVRRSLCSRNYKTGEYVKSKEDPLIQTGRMHQLNINSAMLQTARCLTTELHTGTRQIKESREDNVTQDEKLVDNQWLKYGDIKEETESRSVAAKNQTISTDYF
jgi:hypothetical protein